MAARRLLTLAAATALTALTAVGLVQLAGTSNAPKTFSPAPLTRAQMQARLAGSPAPLAALHAQANELLGGGAEALRRRLASLKGMPVVVNKWNSSCVPCAQEAAAFQRASTNLGRRVAFIGIDSGDTSRSDALRFLREHPQSYPSYADPTTELGAETTDSTFTPVTVFYNRFGKKYPRQGPYPDAAKLESDILRYALEAGM
jgi:cytochrome c biogenesis protein CcmG, thiol:disulfide interchange protein DsbE